MSVIILSYDVHAVQCEWCPKFVRHGDTPSSAVPSRTTLILSLFEGFVWINAVRHANNPRYTRVTLIDTTGTIAWMARIPRVCELIRMYVYMYIASVCARGHTILNIYTCKNKDVIGEEVRGGVTTVCAKARINSQTTDFDYLMILRPWIWRYMCDVFAPVHLIKHAHTQVMDTHTYAYFNTRVSMYTMSLMNVHIMWACACVWYVYKFVYTI